MENEIKTDWYRETRLNTGCAFAETCKAQVCPLDKKLTKARRDDAEWICRLNKGVINGSYPELEAIINCERHCDENRN